MVAIRVIEFWAYSVRPLMWPTLSPPSPPGPPRPAPPGALAAPAPPAPPSPAIRRTSSSPFGAGSVVASRPSSRLSPTRPGPPVSPGLAPAPVRAVGAGEVDVHVDPPRAEAPAAAIGLPGAPDPDIPPVSEHCPHNLVAPCRSPAGPRAAEGRVDAVGLGRNGLSRCGLRAWSDVPPPGATPLRGSPTSPRGGGGPSMGRFLQPATVPGPRPRSRGRSRPGSPGPTRRRR